MPQNEPDAEPARRLTDSGSIPTDSDVEVDESDAGAPTRPPHLRWSLIGLVAIGGAVGTAARAVLSAAAAPVDGLSWVVFAINVVGAFCLGLLLEALAHRGADVGRRRGLRLLLGTGVLGGFTTYSTLATDAATLLQDGRLGAGSGYALSSVVAGVAAVLAGLWVAELLRPSRRSAVRTGGER